MPGGRDQRLDQVQRPARGRRGLGPDPAALGRQRPAAASGAARADAADGEQLGTVGPRGDVGAFGAVAAQRRDRRRGDVEIDRRRLALLGVGRLGCLSLGRCGRLVAWVRGIRAVARLWGVRRGRVVRIWTVVRVGTVVGVGVRLGFVIAEQPVEQVLVEAGGVERVAAPAVRQGEQRGLPDVGAGHRGAPGPGGVRDGGAGGDDVGAQAVHLETGADPGDRGERRPAQRHRAQPGARLPDPVPQRGLLGREPGREPGRVGVEREPAAHHLHPALGVTRRSDLDGEPEPVEQLRPQLALLGVHGADQHEAGGVPDRDAVALDGGAAHSGGVQQQVDQMVVQQVHLVDVEDAAVRAGEQARFEGDFPRRQGTLQVDRTEHAVLGRADGQLHQPHRPGAAGRGGGVRDVG